MVYRLAFVIWIVAAIPQLPAYSPSYYLLGRITEELGLQEEARNNYKAFLARSPLGSADLRADATQRLEKLPK